MTEPQEPNARPAPKLLAAHGIKIRIAAASGLVLTVGALLAPRVAPTALSAPQERPAPLLEEQVQMREVARPFSGVQDVATRLGDHSVAIASAETRSVPTRNDFSETDVPARASGFGVFVSEGYILTHALALEGRTSIPVSAADGRMLDTQVAAYEPASGLVLLQTQIPWRLPAVFASEAPDPGTLAVAVGRWNGNDIAAPVFVMSVEGNRYTVGSVDGSLLPGMPVYNLDGELLAVAGGDQGGHAFPVRETASMLIARASAGERPASLGIAFQELSGLLTRPFGEKGVLISHVIEGGPADLAGLLAGDVLLAVGDVDIDSPDTAALALGSMTVSAATTVRLMRAGRVRTVEVMPVSTYEVAALARVAVDEVVSGTPARTLFPQPLLGRAGIPPSARVLSINGRVVSTRAQALRELRRPPQPAVVSLVHGNRRFFAAVEPAP